MKKNYILSLLVILCLLVFSGCENNGNTKLKEGVDYKIIDNYSKGCGKERGYFIDKSNGPYYYIICMGEQYTGGYSLKVKKVNLVDNNTEVTVEEIAPKEGEMVTMALTSPKITIEFPKYQENIIIKNTKGELFNILD